MRHFNKTKKGLKNKEKYYFRKNVKVTKSLFNKTLILKIYLK